MNGKTDHLYNGALDTGVRINVDLGACGIQEVGYFHQHSDHVDWVFVDHISYHRPGTVLSSFAHAHIQGLIANVPMAFDVMNRLIYIVRRQM